MIFSENRFPLFRIMLCSLENCHAARKIRLRVSQNAAALLFDLGTVDIRRVGTQSRRILVAGCSE